VSSCDSSRRSCARRDCRVLGAFSPRRCRSRLDRAPLSPRASWRRRGVVTRESVARRMTRLPARLQPAPCFTWRRSDPAPLWTWVGPAPPRKCLSDAPHCGKAAAGSTRLLAHSLGPRSCAGASRFFESSATLLSLRSRTAYQQRASALPHRSGSASATRETQTAEALSKPEGYPRSRGRVTGLVSAAAGGKL